MKRTLALKRESLTELSTDELALLRAAGGETDPQPTPPQGLPVTLAVKECLATTQDSMVVCSGDCITYRASCAC